MATVTRTDSATAILNDEGADPLLVFCTKYSVGRTKAFEEIAAGRLIATKLGRRTLIRPRHARAWLDSLPTTATAA
jgi:hypothetical protein